MPADALVVRRYSRPDQPQANYRGALGIAKLWEGWLQVASDDAQRNCSYRTDARRPLDVRGHEWAPSFAWDEKVVDALVATWMPAPTAALKSERISARRPLDVRSYEWAPDDGWVPKQTDTIIRTWVPNWTDRRLGERTPDGKRLDVRSYEWAPDDGWVPKTVDGVLAQWRPVFDAELGYRSLAGPRLDVRGYDWAPTFSWVNARVDSLLAQWRPAIDAEVSFRSADRPTVDVRRVDVPIFDWTQPVVDAVVRQWAPIWLAESLGARSPDGRVLNVREWAAQDGWIVANLPSTVSQAQLWPAILAALDLSYRSGDRAILDVRRVDAPVFGWLQSIVDGTVGLWTPNWTAERTGSGRTGERRRFDVRDQPWFSSWVTTGDPIASTRGPTIILVHGRLAIQLSPFVYEWIA